MHLQRNFPTFWNFIFLFHFFRPTIPSDKKIYYFSRVRKISFWNDLIFALVFKRSGMSNSTRIYYKFLIESFIFDSIATNVSSSHFMKFYRFRPTKNIFFSWKDSFSIVEQKTLSYERTTNTDSKNCKFFTWYCISYLWAVFEVSIFPSDKK